MHFGPTQRTLRVRYRESAETILFHTIQITDRPFVGDCAIEKTRGPAAQHCSRSVLRFLSRQLTPRGPRIYAVHLSHLQRRCLGLWGVWAQYARSSSETTTSTSRQRSIAASAVATRPDNCWLEDRVLSP